MWLNYFNYSGLIFFPKNFALGVVHKGRHGLRGKCVKDFVKTVLRPQKQKRDDMGGGGAKNEMSKFA